MDNHYDIVIVGAGITGLCLANYLAPKGVKILIVDLKNIKRFGECTSGEILTDDSLLFLKNAFNIRIPAKFIERSVESTTIGSINGPSFDVNFKYYFINKKMLAAYLIGKIIDLENVNIIERSMITGLVEEDRVFKSVEIKDMARGSISRVGAKIIVDASGSTAVVRRKIQSNRFFLNEVEDFDRAVIYEEILDAEYNTVKPKILFDPSVIKAGSVWVVPLSNNRINIGLGISGKSSNVKSRFDEYKNRLISAKDSKVIERGTGVIELRRPLNSFVYKNIMLVGSSACQVNPLISRDLGFGLKGAYYAGKAILNSLKNNVINTESLWNYNTNYMKDAGWQCANMECVRDFFASLSTENFDFIIENNIVPPSLIENLHGRLKKRDLLFNSAKLLLKPSLLAKFVKLSDYSNNMKSLYDNYPEYDEFESWKKKLNHELSSIRKSFLV